MLNLTQDFKFKYAYHMNKDGRTLHRFKTNFINNRAVLEFITALEEALWRECYID